MASNHCFTMAAVSRTHGWLSGPSIMHTGAVSAADDSTLRNKCVMVGGGKTADPAAEGIVMDSGADAVDADADADIAADKG
jgi:hypothetical protein